MPDYECAYCGAVGEATDDHVPPRALIGPGPYSSTLPTVKACPACNTGRSADDEYFRDTVLKYHRTADLPAAQSAIDKMLRALQHPQKAGYAAKTMADLTSADVYSPAGIYLGVQPAVKVDGARLERTAIRYARGLHRHELGTRVPETTPSRAVVDPDQVYAAREEFVSGFTGATVVEVKPDTFWYAYKLPPSTPGASYWLLMFYQAFPVVVAFRPTAHISVPSA